MIIKHKIIDFNGYKVLILFLDLNYEFAGFKNNKKELKAEIKGLKSEQRKLNKRLNWYDNSSAARIAASRVKHKIVK